MPRLAIIFIAGLLVACKPSVDSISPKQGAFDVETKVEIAGEGFSAEGLVVTFGGLEARVEASTDTKIEAYAPVQDAPGPIMVKVRNDDGTNDQETVFTYISKPPVISSLDPPSAPSNVRTVICVRGQDLGSTDLKLFVGTSEARILNRAADSIIAIVSPQTSDGEVRAENSHGQGVSQDVFVSETEADLSAGDLVVLKQSRADLDATPSERALSEAVERSATTKDAILAETGSCGLSLGRELSNLPMFQILNTDPDLRARIAADKRVETIEPNNIAFKQKKESMRVINRDQVERRANQRPTEFGKGTAVAVLDTGVDYRKLPYSCATPGGNCRVAYAADFGPNDGQPDDDGHGTNVAAIVTAIAPQADILALDVFTGDDASTVNILAAIDWSIQNQDVYNIVAINMSLGEKTKRTLGECMNNDPYGLAANRARLAGINVIAASGNDGWADGMPRPACSPALISVGAVYDAKVGAVGYPNANCLDPQTEVDQVTCFSNHAHWLSMLAPGARILAGGSESSGTSQAAPHVAGAVAALASIFPTMAPDDRRKRLESSGTPVTNQRAGNGSGETKTRLDLLAAIQGAEGRPLAVDPVGEAWPVAEGLAGTYAAVADVPEFDRANNDTLTDRSSGIGWWKELGPEPPVHLQRAGYRCTRYGPNFSFPIPALRMPTRSEALSLFDFTRMDGFIDPALGNDMASEFWTLSPENRAKEIQNQWSVDYRLGNSNTIGLATSPGSPTKLRHRCIFDRFLTSSPPAPRFILNGPVVEDTATGLIWMSEALKDNQGKVRTHSYKGAASACAASTDGAVQWRLPTVKELLSVMSYSDAVMDGTAFEPQGRMISSSPDLRRNPGSPTVRFLGVDDKSGRMRSNMSSGAVRCVIQNSPKAAPNRHLSGSVDIRTPMDMQALKSGQFESADSIYIQTNDSVRTVVLPGLKTVTGNFYISGGNAITLIWLPDLESVGGGFEVTGNTKLQLLSAPRLVTIGDDFVVSGAENLVGFEELDSVSQPVYMPALKQVDGDMKITRNTWKPWLQVFFNNLASIGGQADFSDNQELLLLGFSNLESIGRNCSHGTDPLCGNLFVERNTGFSGLRMFSIEEISRGLLVRNNPELKSLSLNSMAADSYTRIRSEVDISKNQSYCAKKFDSYVLKWPLTVYPASMSIRENAPSSACQSRCQKFPPSNATDCPIFTGP